MRSEVDAAKFNGRSIFSPIQSSELNNFSSGGRPAQSASFINSYPHRFKPKASTVANQDLNARRNPIKKSNDNGAGGDNADFNKDNNLKAPKRENEPSKISHSSDSYTELTKKSQITFKIEEIHALIKEAENAAKNQDVKREIERLVERMSNGMESPGIGTKPLEGFKTIFEFRAFRGGRLYCRQNDDILEIVATSAESNQNRVIAIFKKNYD